MESLTWRVILTNMCREVLGDNIKIALKGIRQAQKNQESRLPLPEDWQKQVRKEVKRLLRQEMSHMKRAVADSDTSSGPSSGLSPPGPSPSTPLTTPSSQPNSPIRDPSINGQPSSPSRFLSERTSPRTNQPSAARATFSLDSEVSYVSGHQDSTANSGAGLHPPLPTVNGEEDDEAEIEGEGQGIYMPTPLFGPPIPRSRVPNARVSTASLNHDHRISSISPPNKSRKESRSRAHDASTSPRPSTDRHVK
ncbi:hypothetical protein ASPVEDRAFT_417850 [Aspergillus versicolor CBS 583.65]|uniref:Uncharacterized protein n=1 Tax=Aspergillus versicolor CBS 583.65 TaxID=1036611 RepID=A0A1L9Q4Y8_ASPVE|nr:uncharacterized protein ASPVEDRAFT_417850 [Aspergillus versicolor CBS 583.65]OJJ08791.1 hypothetical protein ASPVEDRAFT_417850 [Aspergillus versicolor CBS 583.65]